MLQNMARYVEQMSVEFEHLGAHFDMATFRLFLRHGTPLTPLTARLTYDHEDDTQTLTACAKEMGWTVRQGAQEPGWPACEGVREMELQLGVD